MKLELIGHDEKYAVEQSLLTLFPDERPVYGPVTDEDASAARITLTEDADSVCVTTELRCGGKAAADCYSYPLSGTDYEKEGQRRHALGLSFFRAAKEVLGVTPGMGQPHRRAPKQGRRLAPARGEGSRRRPHRA